MSRLLNDVGLSHYDEKIKEYINSRPAVDSIFTRAANTTPETVPTRLQISLLDIFGPDKIDSAFGGKIKIQLVEGTDYEAELDLSNRFYQQGFDVNRINSAILVAYNRNIPYMEGAALSSASSLYEFDKAILVQRDYNQSKRLFHYMVGHQLYASSYNEKQLAPGNLPDPYGKTYSQTDGSLCGYMFSDVPSNCKPVDPFTGLTNVFLKSVYLKTKQVGQDSHTCLCFCFGHFDISTNPYLESEPLVSTQGRSSENPFTLLLNPADFEG